MVGVTVEVGVGVAGVLVGVGVTVGVCVGVGVKQDTHPFGSEEFTCPVPLLI